MTLLHEVTSDHDCDSVRLAVAEHRLRHGMSFGNATEGSWFTDGIIGTVILL